MKKNILLILIGGFLSLFMVSCKKGPGEGGSSSIKGYVHVKDYNATLLVLQGEYDGYDEDIYIIYGDDISYGNHIKSGPDGKFEFNYLREGTYKVYVYSDDTTLAGKTAVVKQVEISSDDQVVDAGTFEIKKN